MYIFIHFVLSFHISHLATAIKLLIYYFRASFSFQSHHILFSSQFRKLFLFILGGILCRYFFSGCSPEFETYDIASPSFSTFLASLENGDAFQHTKKQYHERTLIQHNAATIAHFCTNPTTTNILCKPGR